MKINLLVQRFHPNRDTTPREQAFELEVDGITTVLDVLLEAHHVDPTLSFRKSCRSTICGSCAMMINDKPALACHKRVTDVVGPEGGTIRLAPLQGFRPVKDLVVDLDPLFAALGSVVPWLLTRKDHDGLVSPEDAAKVVSPALCILCGACEGLIRHDQDISAAAVVKNWRFALDVRDRLGEQRFELLEMPDEVLSLFTGELKKLCPKEVLLARC